MNRKHRFSVAAALLTLCTSSHAQELSLERVAGGFDVATSVCAAPGDTERLFVTTKGGVIHIIRDGRDVAASQITEHSGWGYGDIAEAAEKWVAIIEKSRRNAEKHAAPMLEIRYEDLILDNESTLRRIMDFIEEPWSDTLLRHETADHDFFQTRVGHPSRARTQQPLDASAIGRHRRDLAAEQIASFESIAGGMLESLGYECGTGLS